MSAERWKIGNLLQGNEGTLYQDWLGLIVKEEDGWYYFHWLILPPSAWRPFAVGTGEIRASFHLCKS
jgi:hypothetical protein